MSSKGKGECCTGTKRARASQRKSLDDSHASRQQDGESPSESAGAASAADAAVSDKRIRVAAYFLAERRGFAPGYELTDWLAAEAAVRTGCQADAP